MSFINDIAFDERVDELEVEGHLRVGGDILLHGEFPKMDQQIAALNSSISLKANQSDLDVVVVTLNMKADHEEVVASLSLKADQSELRRRGALLLSAPRPLGDPLIRSGRHGRYGKATPCSEGTVFLGSR